MDLLQGRVAVVTGSSRGIGRAIAQSLADEGCKVVINFRASADAAARAASEIEGRNPGSTCVIQADVTRESETAAMMEAAVRRFGRIDILVNNAGVAQGRGFLDISPEDWRRMIETNLTGAFLCCRAAIPFMLQGKWGRIVNIASTSGLTGGTSGAHYAAAKAGVIALTKSLSSEFAPRGITVNSVVPSKIETEMLRSSLDERGRTELLKRIPVRRFGTPQEIGNIVAFIASDRAAYITGEMIVASGGYR
jgi:3-oxoacyl-[acyl-carrier protein] reductase